MKFWRPALIVAAILWPAWSALAQTVTFDFDTGTPQAWAGEGTPLSQTSQGVTASFSSPSDPAAYSVQNAGTTFWTLSLFSGNYLSPSTVYKSFLDVKFDHQLTTVTFAFATADFQQVEIPSPIRVSAYEDSVNNPAVGSATSHGTYGSDTMPMGTITFDSGGVPFNLIRIDLPPYANGASDFLVDNIAVTLQSSNSITSLTMTPPAVVGGKSSTGTVSLFAPAAAGGALVTLSGGVSAIGFPTSVTVPYGKKSATFQVTSTPVATQHVETLTAALGKSKQTAALTVNPPQVASLILTAPTVYGGNGDTATVTLSGIAPSGNASVSLSSSDPVACPVPSPVVVPAGLIKEAFSFVTNHVSVDETVTLTATLNGSTRTAALLLLSGRVTGFTLSPASIVSGNTVMGTLVINEHAGPGGDVVNLVSSPALVTVPATVTIPAGRSYVYLYFPTKGVSSATAVQVTASREGSSKSATVTLLPAQIAHLLPTAAVIQDGSSLIVTALLNGLAGSNTSITVASSNTAALTVPASVPVPEGTGTVKFTATSYDVNSDVIVTITATCGVAKTSTITVKAAALSSIALAKTTIVGGFNTFGEVYLSGPAGTAGATILLSSSDPEFAKVPSSVFVPSTKLGAYFTLVTFRVHTNHVVTITATMGSISKSVTLTVTP